MGIVLAIALTYVPTAQSDQSDPEGDLCTDRLLLAGSETSDSPAALWWFWPDEGRLRQVETDGQRAYLVALSPDRNRTPRMQGPAVPTHPDNRFVSFEINLRSFSREPILLEPLSRYKKIAALRSPLF